MGSTWGNLAENEREVIKRRARRVDEAEISRRFAQRADAVVFRVYRRTERALAEGLALRAAMAEEVGEYETVEVPLISPEDFDYEPVVTAADERAARPIDEAVSLFKDYYAQDTVILVEPAAVESEALAAGLPAVVDHRASQSPVKYQGDRGTCVAHASMGLLEAYDHIPDDLSEQYTHYKFNEFLHRPHDQNAGLTTTDAAPFLARPDGRVCLEAEWPYIPSQTTINQMVNQGTYGPPAAAVNNQTYGIGGYKIIPDRGLTGESIRNTRYLETLLHQGYHVVIGTWVSWDDMDNDGILDPVLDPSGNPIGQGGHAMLVVGYNRPEQYFILKNSWDQSWGHQGYGYFHYDLVRSCFKYGFVVHSVVPEAAVEPEPWWRRLLAAFRRFFAQLA